MALTLSKICLAVSPSPTLTIDARAKAMKAQGLDVVGFGAGEPDFDTPAYIRDAAKYALDHGYTRYTPAAGMLDLRKAICKKLERDNGLSYEPGQVIVGNGAKHSLFSTFMALLNPGDEVIIPAPFWVSYPEIVRMAGGVPVYVPMNEEKDFVFTAEDVAPYVTERTKALILNSPGNPSGAILGEAELRGIADLAVERGFYVVSDEIYEKLIYDGSRHISIASLGEAILSQTIVINGMSKAYAMTGWRIGYAAGPKEIIKAMSSYQSHATSNPNAVAQFASITALEGGEDLMQAMVREFDARRKFIVQAINDVDGLACPTPKGAFYVMMNIKGLVGKRYRGETITGSMDFAAMLLDAQKVAVVPGAPFGAEGFCRLSYATSLSNIEKGISRIAAFARELMD